MLSESARMSSAAESRFRVQAANSTPRATTVIALDARSESVVRRLAKASWNQAAFFTAASFAGGGRGDPEPVDGWLKDLEGRTRNLMNEVDTTDLVVMIASAGSHAHAASIIGEACSLERVMTTALIVGLTSASDEALSKTLAHLRPWSLMVVTANADDYVDGMLVALRA